MKLFFKGSKYLPEYHGFAGKEPVNANAGDVVDVPDEKAAGLLKDFPGVFMPAKDAPKDRQVKGPVADRQVKGTE